MSRHHKSKSRSSSNSNNNQNDQLCLEVEISESINSNISNHFGYAWFSLELNVNPSLSSNTTIDAQPINAKLLYGDGQLVDVENDMFITQPQALFLNQNGCCSFKVRINTYSTFHNNRTFKITFQCSENATRHIISCETNTFRLVKHRLEIVVEPEEKFYKDEGGRANCLNCTIVLKNSKRHTVKNRDIPLNVKLVYNPDLSVAQSSRDILEILTQKIHLQNGECHLDFRINEVSKNHNKRAFSVLVECQKNDPLSNDISSCHTRPIMVYSKRTKPRNKKIKKRTKRKHIQITNNNNSDSEFDHSFSETDEDIDRSPNTDEPQFKRRKFDQQNTIKPNPYIIRNYTPFDANYLSSTVRNTNNTLLNRVPGIMPSVINHGICGLPYHPPLNSIGGLNSRKLGPAIFKSELSVTNANTTKNGLLGKMFDWCKLAEYVMQRLEWTKCGYEYNEATSTIDASRPLYRCAYCLRYKNQNGWGSHESWCQLQQALLQYQEKIQSNAREYYDQCISQPIGSMNILDQNQCAPQMNHSSQTNTKSNMNLNTVLTTHSMNTGNKHKNNTNTGENVSKNGISNSAENMNILPNMHGMSFGLPNGISYQLPSMMSPIVSGNTMMFPGMLLNSPSMMFMPVPPHLMSFNNNSNVISTVVNNDRSTDDKVSHSKSISVVVVDSNGRKSRNDGNSDGKNKETVEAAVVEESNVDEIKDVVGNGSNGHSIDGNTNVRLPTIMSRINSVYRERSKHGFAAYDNNQELLGFFDDNSSFLNLGQMSNFDDQFSINSEFNFDDMSAMNFMMRCQSNDFRFFQEIQNNIGSSVNGGIVDNTK